MGFLGPAGASLLFQGLKGRKDSLAVETLLSRRILEFRNHANKYEEWKAGFAGRAIDPDFFVDACKALDWPVANVS
jgi:hypothetical protein